MPDSLGVVLAAGRGKRLRPLTDHRSKATLPVAGRPMVERVMEMLARDGVSRFVVVVHPDDQALIERLEGSAWADRVRLVYQEQRGGMAHALECAVFYDTKDLLLHLKRNGADLIQKKGPTVGSFKTATSSPIRPGECPLLIAKQLGFNERGIQCRAVQGDKGGLPTIREIVQSGCGQFFA